MSEGGYTYACPRGPRDSKSWYRDADPMEQVDGALVEFVSAHAGRRVLDLGCGLGGYTRALADRGFDVRGIDVSPEYVERARSLGVPVDLYDGGALPYEDGSFDSVAMLEVLEHLDDPAALLREARRVARRGVLVSVPNSTQDFGKVPVEFSHMLDVDHRQFFTVDSLTAFLRDACGSAVVEETAPIDGLVLGLMLPRPLRPLYRGLVRVGAAQPRFYSRLLGRGPA